MGTDDMLLSLRALPNEEKLLLADIYKSLANDLIEQVEHAEKTAAQWRVDGHRLDIRHGIPDAMIEALNRFHDEAEAVQHVSREMRTSPSNVRHHWKAHKKDEAAKARLIRDREILKQARAGRTNAEIARKFGISRPYVSKIVTRDFRRFARYGDHSHNESP